MCAWFVGKSISGANWLEGQIGFGGRFFCGVFCRGRHFVKGVFDLGGFLTGGL